MNYQIIKDEKLLKQFIDWLPELGEREKYYMCLFARNKYCAELTHIKTDKAQLKRFVTDKARMFQKIKQLEIAEGWYLQKETIVPQRALALYITPNPREMWKASFNSLVKLAHCIRDQNILVNPHQEVLSEIQRSKSRTCYVDFDIDTKEPAVINKVKEVLDKILIHPAVLETRGGYHVLINPENVNPEYANKWYQMLSGFADQTGDNMIPVPGCTQGDFVPHFVNLTHVNTLQSTD